MGLGARRVPWLWVVLALAVIGGGVGLALLARRSGATPPSTAPATGAASTVVAAAVTPRPATPSPTSLLTVAPTFTVAPTLTPLPSPTATSTPTALPSPTTSPTPSPTPGAYARLAGPLGLNVRRGPSLYYPIVARLTDTALELTVSGRDAAGRWWQVCCVTPEGEEGWVSVDYVTLTGPTDLVPIIAEPPTPFLTTAKYVNLRRGPGVAYPLVQVIPADVAFGVIGRSAASDWWQVCCWAGQPGWLSANFVTLVGDAAAVPIMADVSPAP